ncbi:MAG: ATP-binding cassette domain-containing protein, partial [Sinobacteraceae bacterium]|nr:ATP-binding cassette domain-containing protein [Nevskiaceae bacterium]
SSFRVVAQDLYLARTRVASAVEPALDWHNRPQHTIRLDGVGFRYDPERPCALSGVTLTIAARMVVGVVGPNGAGKTTLADVVAGLLSPDSGTLSVDGTTITDDNRAAWQQCIAYVPQQTFLLDTTLAQNVALGVPEDQIDRERLRRALQLAQLDELVEALPRGCEQRVGERGVTLSGGQRQRLSIARALYRNASVLILDEATSALDGLTEQELMSALQRLRGQCTLVLIAHRLGALRSCDVIFELQAGALRDGGTYAELLARSSALRAMAEAG